jgi:hypothetical protein
MSIWQDKMMMDNSFSERMKRRKSNRADERLAAESRQQVAANNASVEDPSHEYYSYFAPTPVPEAPLEVKQEVLPVVLPVVVPAAVMPIQDVVKEVKRKRKAPKLPPMEAVFVLPSKIKALPEPEKNVIWHLIRDVISDVGDIITGKYKKDLSHRNQQSR